ncbi:MAG TPA: hypothetical protein PKZ84_08040 [Anaerolineae bacterium]|nr:hypothetical protein [Anaerolineae bacterium]HQI84325.1 hypothetical protein [Anaerolineae bacterium]
MKAIHYDTEGDILSVTFAESAGQPHAGVELTDNIVLYYNPKTQQPLKLIIVSYQAMVQASAHTPLALDTLSRAPASVQAMALSLLRRAPLTAFFQMVEQPESASFASRLREIFAPAALQMAST